MKETSILSIAILVILSTSVFASSRGEGEEKNFKRIHEKRKYKKDKVSSILKLSSDTRGYMRIDGGNVEESNSQDYDYDEACDDESFHSTKQSTEEPVLEDYCDVEESNSQDYDYDEDYDDKSFHSTKQNTEEHVLEDYYDALEDYYDDYSDYYDCSVGNVTMSSWEYHYVRF
mmetsp:Transcript_21172/g.31134  ORF Transcript_21172/g.31134 Transcript_21172/m.31134 type:complete len:173 (-) Transcript_21172:220-738(-)